MAGYGVKFTFTITLANSLNLFFTGKNSGG
jgi:hypothetical protein